MTDEAKTLQETYECLVEKMGLELGALLRCIVQQEIQSHADRINQLQQILNGSTCKPGESNPSNGVNIS